MAKRAAINESEDWVSPSNAINLISHYAGNVFVAKQVIADGLRSQKIDVAVDTVWEERDGAVGEDKWVPKKARGMMFETDVEIDRSFWRGSEGWPDDLAHWRWDSGEFVLFGTPYDFEFTQMFFMNGVTMRRSDILALVGRSNRAGAGGPKPDRERWADFWANVLYETTGKTFDWTQFDNPYQLKQQLHEWSGGQFSENNIDIAVDAVWKCIVLRCADDQRAGPGSGVSAE